MSRVWPVQGKCQVPGSVGVLPGPLVSAAPPVLYSELEEGEAGGLGEAARPGEAVLWGLGTLSRPAPSVAMTEQPAQMAGEGSSGQAGRDRTPAVPLLPGELTSVAAQTHTCHSTDDTQRRYTVRYATLMPTARHVGRVQTYAHGQTHVCSHMCPSSVHTSLYPGDSHTLLCGEAPSPMLRQHRGMEAKARVRGASREPGAEAAATLKEMWWDRTRWGWGCHSLDTCPGLLGTVQKGGNPGLLLPRSGSLLTSILWLGSFRSCPWVG